VSDLPVVIRTFPLGARAELRVILDTFNGQPRVDLRTWCDYSVGPANVRGPTKKGVSFPIAQVPALVSALSDALEHAGARGMLEKGGVEAA
jgi:hypothetical protein